MSGVPRSQALIKFHSTAAGFSPLWSTPAGYVTLVKSVHAYNTTAGELDLEVVMGWPGAGGNLSFVKTNIQPTAPYEWNGWLALNPGDYVGVYVAGGGVWVVVSGAVLAGPNQFPPAARESVELLPEEPQWEPR